MPYFFGVGLHVIVALFFAIHAVRSGRPIYWLFILFMFPLLGSVVYFVAEYLPNSRMQHTVRKTATAAVRSLDPGRELREARHAHDLAPTAQNRMRLAAALLDAGDAHEAAEHYEACLHGPFAADLEIRFGAARARLLSGNAAAALELLLAIRKDDPAFRAEAVSLTLARAQAETGRDAEARAEFESAVAKFGSMDARVEYTLWAQQVGDHATATAQRAEIDATVKHWSRHTREMNQVLLKRLG